MHIDMVDMAVSVAEPAEIPDLFIRGGRLGLLPEHLEKADTAELVETGAPEQSLYTTDFREDTNDKLENGLCRANCRDLRGVYGMQSGGLAN